MKNKNLLIFIVAVLLIAAPMLVRAQFEVRVPIKKMASSPPPSSSAPKTRTVTKIQKVYVKPEVRTEIRTQKYKTTNLSVNTEAGAEVLLTSSIKGVPPIKRIADENGFVIFEDIKPTTTPQMSYEITVSLDGYISQNQDDIKVSPQTTIGLNFELKPIEYQLEIKTNIRDGEVRYAPARLVGKESNGSLQTTETGGYCFAPIKNNKAIIKKLQKGYYNLDIRPSELEYQITKTAVSLGTDADEEDQTQSYTINLDKKISTDNFDATWVQSSWILPNGFRVQDERMTIAGATGVALPSSELHRYYHNFEMISGVRSLDGKSVGFALRAEDPHNYYFIQISGANAAEPYVTSGYLVKNDKPVKIFSGSIAHLAQFIAPGKDFRVIIRSNENKFKIALESSETGESIDIGEMTDRDDNLRKGAVGIASRGNSNFEVLDFHIFPR